MSFLRRYANGAGHVDCYRLHHDAPVTQAQYVEAFYTTAVFKIERRLLAWFVSRPSTDGEARQLALGQRSDFAAWSVEARDDSQLLLCDFQGRTRSWLMCLPSADGRSTLLCFGSAVVPIRDPATGESRMGGVFRALLEFHRIYSRVLLKAAAGRLRRTATAA